MGQELVLNLVFVSRTFATFFKYCFLYALGYYNSFECFKKCTEELGKLNIFFVKALQALSSNANLLTQEQIDYVTVYTDHVPFEPCEVSGEFAQSLQHTAREHGHTLEFDRNAAPVKSGMIALVYSAKLNSKPVVIKVMRAGVKKRLEDALRKVHFLVRVVSWFPYVRNLQLLDIFTENRSNLITQTNFTNEKDNILRMFKNCEHTEYINVPTVYPEFTNANDSIIVMSYLEGKKLDELVDDEKDEYCRLLAKFGMKCLLFNRFYHADLHPGNIVFMKDADGNFQLGILDYGIMGEITKEEQAYFHKFFVSIASARDGGAAAADNILDGLVQPMSLMKELSAWDHNNLRAEIGGIIGEVLHKVRNFTPEDMFRINTVLRKYKLSLSKSFCRIELSLAIADSVSTKLSHKTSYLENVKEAVNSMFETSIIDCARDEH